MTRSLQSDENTRMVAPAATSNRLTSPILPVDLSDEDVVGRWLAAKATGRGRLATTTLAQYRIEAERLFWYARRIDRSISGWTLDEFAAYIAFLQAPAPWAVRARGVRRGSPDWRPFLGPLSDRSAGQTQKIVTALFDWLRDVGYLQLNPAVGLPTTGRRKPEKQSRFLSPDDTALIREAIAARPETTREARLSAVRDTFVIDLFELTGLRTTEAVRCQMANVRIEPLPAQLKREFPDAPPFQWLLRVERGKGGKARWVPCDEIALSLQAYRLAFGLTAVPSPEETLPLLLSVRQTRWRQWKGLRDRTTVWKLVRSLCEEAIAFARTQQRHHEAERLNAASTHWLRHSYAKGLAAALGKGLDARAALDNMGHSDLRTFQQYVDDEPLRRAVLTRRARARTT